MKNDKINVLLTGASGQLGICFRKIVDTHQKNPNICPNVDDYSFFYTDVASDGNVSALDITNEGDVKDFVIGNNIKVIINCAAYTNVDGAEQNIDVARKINADGPMYLAKAAKKNDAVLIHISTDYVFDGKLDRPYRENDEKHPLNVYGKTKSDGENNIIFSGCKHIILRTQWLYSNYGKNFYKSIRDRLLENWEFETNGGCPTSLCIVDDQTGSPTSANDLAGFIFKLLLYDKEQNTLSKTGIYNYSNCGVANWYDFAKEIARQFGKMTGDSNNLEKYVRSQSTENFVNECIKNGKFPATRPSYSVLDLSKILYTFGFNIPTWKQALSDIVLDFETIKEQAEDNVEKN